MSVYLHSESAAPRALSPERILAHAQKHQFRSGDIDWQVPFDRSCWLLCPSLTPLYYASIYAELNEAQQLRYNQISGVCSNELAGLFERWLQPIFESMVDDARVPADMRSLLPGFVADECFHADIWWQLNQLAEPDWYRTVEYRLVKLPRVVRWLIHTLARHPVRFPMAVWTVMALEEHALEIARRTMQTDVMIEPRFKNAYRLHAQDEARHVQIDLQLFQHLFERLSPRMRAINVRLFRAVIDRFLLKPVNAADQVVRALIAEFPELQSRYPEMRAGLEQLSTSPGYREMIFSPRACPITFELIRQWPESRKAFADLL